MSTPLLALVGVVKNEAECITKTIESIRGIVDHFTITDTGSNDGTVAILKKSMGGQDRLFTEAPFVDYAQARNLAIENELLHETPATFCLMLSADETLHGAEDLRSFLEDAEGCGSEVFLVEVRTPTGSFDYPRIVRTNSPWRYVGAIHEELRHSGDPKREPAVKAPCWIEYKPSDPERLAKRLREVDLPLLRQQFELAAGLETHARLAVLLAQTHEQLAVNHRDDISKWLQEKHAALAWYTYVLAIAEQKTTTYAQWKFLNVSEELGIFSSQEMVDRLAPLAKANPDNAPVAFMLAAHLAKVDARNGLHAAYRAAEVARKAVRDLEHPHDPYGLLWRPYQIACLCAQALGHGPAVKKAAAAGLAAGGPPEVFDAFQ